MTLVDRAVPADASRRDDPPKRGRLAGPTGRGARRLVALLSAFAALATLYALAVRTGVGQRIDNAPVLRHHLTRTPDGDISTWNLGLLLTTVALAPIVVWVGRANRRMLLLYGGAAVGAVLLAEVSREVLTRPALGVFDPLYGASYPSGHAAAAMALALALIALADGPWVRRLAPIVPAVVGALVVAIPIHRPSDVLAGFAIAVAAMTVARWTSRRLGQPPTGLDQRATHWPASVLRACAVTAAFLAAEAVAVRRAHLDLADLGWTFPVTVLALVLAAEATVLAFRVICARRSPVPSAASRRASRRR